MNRRNEPTPWNGWTGYDEWTARRHGYPQSRRRGRGEPVAVRDPRDVALERHVVQLERRVVLLERRIDLLLGLLHGLPYALAKHLDRDRRPPA